MCAAHPTQEVGGYTYSTPQYATRAHWDMSMGMQKVDGLEVSSYLRELAEENIHRRCDFSAIALLLEQQRKKYSAAYAEADIVSSRMAEILTSEGFSFRPSAIFSLHRFLFTGVFAFAGEARTCNITKSEAVLHGRSVFYADHRDIADNLEYDFAQEEKRQQRYARDDKAFITHFSLFIRNIWQTHPFMEGNTRTTAIFATRYLQNRGYAVDVSLFAEKAQFFRNALVRACFADYTHGIGEDRRFLENFFDNALFRTAHTLRNRDTVCWELFPPISPTA